MERLRTRFSNVISLRFDSPITDATDVEATRLDQLARNDPAELFASFLTEVRGSAPDEDEQALIRKAIETKTGSETRS